MDEPRKAKPDAEADAERARSEKSRSTDEPAKDGKPDEGIPLDRLTTENDGGSQG